MDELNTIDLSSYDTLITHTRERLSCLKDDKRGTKSKSNANYLKSSNARYFNTFQTESNTFPLKSQNKGELSPFIEYSHNRVDTNPRQYRRDSPIYQISNKDNKTQPKFFSQRKVYNTINNDLTSKSTKETIGNILTQKNKYRPIRLNSHSYRNNFDEIYSKLTDIRNEKESILNNFIQFKQDYIDKVKTIEEVLNIQEKQAKKLLTIHMKEKNDLVKENSMYKVDLLSNLQKSKEMSQDFNNKIKEIKTLTDDIFHKDKQMSEIKSSLSNLKMKYSKYKKENMEFQELIAKQKEENSKLSSNLSEANEMINKNKSEIDAKTNEIAQLKNKGEEIIDQVKEERGKNKDIIDDWKQSNEVTFEYIEQEKPFNNQLAEMESKESKYIKEIIELKTRMIVLKNNQNEESSENKCKSSTQINHPEINQVITQSNIEENRASERDPNPPTLINQLEELNTHNNALKLQIKDLNDSNTYLKEETQRLISELDTLKSINTRFQLENEEFKSHALELWKGIDHLQNENKELSKQGTIIDHESKDCKEVPIKAHDKFKKENPKLNIGFNQRDTQSKYINIIDYSNVQIEDLPELSGTFNQNYSRNQYAIQETDHRRNTINFNPMKDNSLIKDTNNAFNNVFASLAKTKDNLIGDNIKLREKLRLSEEEIIKLNKENKTLESRIESLNEGIQLYNKNKENTQKYDHAPIQQEIDLLKETNNIFNSKIPSLQELTNTLSEDKSQLTQQAVSSKEEINLLIQAKNSLNNTVRLLKEENASLIQEKLEIKTNLSSLQEEINSYKERNQSLNDTISLLKEANATLNQDKTHQFVSSNEEIGLQDETNFSLRDTIKSLKEETKILNQDNMNLTEQLIEYKKTIDSLQAKENHQKEINFSNPEKIETVEILNKQISILYRQIQHANEEKNQLQNDKQLIQSKLEKANEDLSIISKEMAVMRESNSILIKEKIALESLQSSHMTLKNEKEDLTKLLFQTKAEITQLKQLNNQSQTQEPFPDTENQEYVNLKNRNSLLSNEVSILKRENENQKKEIDSISYIKKEIETLKIINDNLSNKLSNVSQNNSQKYNTFEQENSFLKQTIEQKDQTISDLKTSNEALVKDCYNHMIKIQSLESHIKVLESSN